MIVNRKCSVTSLHFTSLYLLSVILAIANIMFQRNGPQKLQFPYLRLKGFKLQLMSIIDCGRLFQSVPAFGMKLNLLTLVRAYGGMMSLECI